MTTDKAYMRRNAEMHMVPLAKNDGGAAPSGLFATRRGVEVQVEKKKR
jgi:hypothetical protein